MSGKLATDDFVRCWVNRKMQLSPAAAFRDVCRTPGLIEINQATQAKELLHRIVAMLTKLAR